MRADHRCLSVMLVALALAAGCRTQVGEGPSSGAPPMTGRTKISGSPCTYPFLVHPEEYPGYDTAPTPPLTREQTGNAMQFKGYAMDAMAQEVGDFFSRHGKGGDGSAPLPIDEPMRGSVVKLSTKGLLLDNGLDDAAAPFYSLQSLPSPMKTWLDDQDHHVRISCFKQHRIPSLDGSPRGEYSLMSHVDGEYSRLTGQLYKLMGSRYWGMSYSESDMEYAYFAPTWTFPLSRDKRRHFLDYQDYMGSYSGKAGDRIYISMNGAFWHYHAREPAVTYVGAQSFHRGNVNPRLHYAYLRGASRQYGRLIGNQFSLGDQWGNKTWISDGAYVAAEAFLLDYYDGEIPQVCPPIPWHSPVKGLAHNLLVYFRFRGSQGASLNLCRRMAYTTYLYNAMAFTWEMGELPRIDKKTETEYRLTPLGKLYNMVGDYIKKAPNPGVMHAPVAVLLDFGDGWRPPTKHLKNLKTWSALNYDAGDYLTYNIFSLLFPGHENVGLFENQRYALTDTPYGDMADVLLSDVRPEILGSYGLVIAAGSFTHDPLYVRSLVEDFATQGGVFVVTGENAGRLWPEWGIGQGATLIGHVGDQIAGADGTVTTESHDFELLPISNLPASATVMATLGENPVLFEAPMGKGKVVVHLTPNGIQQRPLPAQIPYHDEKGFDPRDTSLRPVGVTRRRHLTDHYRAVLDEVLKGQRLFSLDTPYLGYITCRQKPGVYTLGIANDTLTARPFAITSHIGKIEKIEEIHLADADYIKGLPEYYPHCLQGHDGGVSDTHTIMSGDMRLFRIRVNEKNLRVIPKASIPPFTNRLLAMPSFHFLQRRLSMWPAFFNYFDGVKLPGQALLDTAADVLPEESKWYNRRKVRLLVDARTISSPRRQRELVAKLSFFTGPRALIVPDIDPELQEAAGAAGIVLHKPGANRAFRFVGATGDHRPSPAAAVTVLDRYYDTWDAVYAGLEALEGAATASDLGGKPILPRAVPTSGRSAPAPGAQRFLSVWEQDDVPAYLSASPFFFKNFDGIMLDAHYLRTCSAERWQRDYQWLRQADVTAAVDFSRSIFGFRRIGFYPQRKLLYHQGMDYASDVFAKMKRAGIKQAVFVLERRQHPDLSDLDAGVAEFCRRAAEHAVTLHLRPSHGKTVPLCEMLIRRLQAAGKAANLHVACSLSFDPADAKRRFSQPQGPGLALLSYARKEERLGVLRPLHEGYTKDAPLIRSLSATRDGIKILDAEYLHHDDLLEDLALLNWVH